MTRLPAVEVTRVILDARAIAELLHHFDIVYHALFHAFRFNELALLFEGFHLLHHVLLNFPDGLGQGFTTGHKQVRRIDGDRFEVHDLLAGIHMNRMNRFDFITEECDAHGIIGISQVHIHIIALHTEGTSGEISASAAVQAFHQSVQETLTAHGLAALDGDYALVKFYRVANTVDARNTGNHYHVASAAEQGAGGREA